jgi:ribosomal protein L20A (L18A)
MFKSEFQEQRAAGMHIILEAAYRALVAQRQSLRRLQIEDASVKEEEEDDMLDA